jgi:hypothetical protein
MGTSVQGTGFDTRTLRLRLHCRRGNSLSHVGLQLTLLLAARLRLPVCDKSQFSLFSCLTRTDGLGFLGRDAVYSGR